MKFCLMNKIKEKEKKEAELRYTVTAAWESPEHKVAVWSLF